MSASAASYPLIHPNTTQYSADHFIVYAPLIRMPVLTPLLASVCFQKGENNNYLPTEWPVIKNTGSISVCD